MSKYLDNKVLLDRDENKADGSILFEAGAWMVPLTPMVLIRSVLLLGAPNPQAATMAINRGIEETYTATDQMLKARKNEDDESIAPKEPDVLKLTDKQWDIINLQLETYLPRISFGTPLGNLSSTIFYDEIVKRIEEGVEPSKAAKKKTKKVKAEAGGKKGKEKIHLVEESETHGSSEESNG